MIDMLNKPLISCLHFCSQTPTDPAAAAAAAGDDPAAALAAAHAAAAAATAAAMKEVELPANLEEDLVSPYDDGISGNPVGELQEVCMNRRMQPPVYEVRPGLPQA